MFRIAYGIDKETANQTRETIHALLLSLLPPGEAKNQHQDPTDS
jgi:hypothetical protein